MPKVLVVATGRKTKGGITAVIKAYEKTTMWNAFHCHWIQTHRDGATIWKFCYLLTAWIDYLIRLPFYDIVHLHFSLPVSAKRKFPFFKLAKILGKKTIVHLHCGDQLPEIWSSVYEKMFIQADKALLLSENIKCQISEYIGNNGNLDVLYNPCPIVDYITPLPVRKKEILVAGTINRNKGYEDIIMAWARIARKYPDWKVIFAGNGEIDRAQSIVLENNITEQVEFTGWVDRDLKAKVFHCASVLCMASYAEGFPMAVLDAWSYGLPVITTPTGGLPDIADNGRNMLLFEPGNIDQLAACLEKIINDDMLRASLASESLKLASTTFNIDTIHRQISEFYEFLSEN